LGSFAAQNDHLASIKMNAIKFSIVAAMNTLRGIGKEGGLPWRLSGDMRFFKSLTTTTTV
jgi:dihydrofolate reductase